MTALWFMVHVYIPTFLHSLAPCCLFLQDSCEEVRDRFAVKLNKGLLSLKVPLSYFSIFALAGADPRREERLEVTSPRRIALNPPSKRIKHANKLYCGKIWRFKYIGTDVRQAVVALPYLYSVIVV